LSHWSDSPGMARIRRVQESAQMNGATMRLADSLPCNQAIRDTFLIDVVPPRLTVKEKNEFFQIHHCQLKNLGIVSCGLC